MSRWGELRKDNGYREWGEEGRKGVQDTQGLMGYRREVNVMETRTVVVFPRLRGVTGEAGTPKGTPTMTVRKSPI